MTTQITREYMESLRQKKKDLSQRVKNARTELARNPSRENGEALAELVNEHESVSQELQDLLHEFANGNGHQDHDNPGSRLGFNQNEFTESPTAVGDIEEFARSNSVTPNRFGRRLLGGYTMEATLAMTGGAIRAMESRSRLMSQATGRVTTTPGMSTAGLDRILPLLEAPVTLLDLIPSSEMLAGIVPYAREVAAAGDAAPVAPGTIKPMLDFAYEDDAATAETVAGWTKVYKQQVRDVPGLDTRLRQRLPEKVRQALEAQVLNGTGVSPQLGPGLLVDPLIPEVVYSATPYLMDLILGAVISLMNVGVTPIVTVLNPTDLGTMLGSKTTTENDYVGSGPFAGSLQPTIWGTAAVASPAVPAGTALVGDTRQGSRLWVREAVQVYISDQDQDDFVKNQLTFLAEGAWAFTNEQPEAWRKVDLSAPLP